MLNTVQTALGNANPVIVATVSTFEGQEALLCEGALNFPVKILYQESYYQVLFFHDETYTQQFFDTSQVQEVVDMIAVWQGAHNG